MKEFADDNFKFVENSVKFFKKVENTVGKEEILVTSNFFFSHSVFKRPVLQTYKDKSLFGKGLIFNCCPGVPFISTLHNILPKQLAAFLHNQNGNNGQPFERNESCHIDYHQSSEEYWQSRGSNQRPPVLILGPSLTGSTRFFLGMSMDKTLQSPSPVLLKPKKDKLNHSFCHDMTEILLKAALIHYHTIPHFDALNIYMIAENT